MLCVMRVLVDTVAVVEPNKFNDDHWWPFRYLEQARQFFFALLHITPGLFFFTTLPRRDKHSPRSWIIHRTF